MDRHLSRTALVRLFSGRGAQPEQEAVVPHIFRCGPCRDVATKVVAELRRTSALVMNSSSPLAEILTLLEKEERQALDQLKARAWWAELRGLSHRQQLERLRSVATLQSKAMFEAVISEAASVTTSDPHLAEETALTALAVAEFLSGRGYSKAYQCDLQGEALVAVANCRRLAANWSGSQAALKDAGMLLKRGTGDPSLEARRLSIGASLASDMGNLEAARDLIARAAALFKADKNAMGLASAAVQEASILLAGLHFEDAICCAQEALGALPPQEARLEMLAKSIVTECLVELGRRTEALRNFVATRPVYEQFRSQLVQLKVAYLEARLLACYGCFRESEKSFREVIKGHIEEELYKDAFLITLTFFETLYKRGALDKAAKVCEDASKLLDTPLCHDQMKQVWAELLEQVRSRALTVGRVLQVRLYLQRHWSVPAARLPFAEVSIPLVLEATESEPVPLPAQPAPVAPEPPEPPPSLADGGYETALERYDRQLVAAAFEESGGRIRETARLLGISRNTLRAKMGKYGL